MQFDPSPAMHPPSSPLHQPHFGQQQQQSAPQHHVPFTQPPGAAPGSLGFGFGLGAASHMNVSASGWGASGSSGARTPGWGAGSRPSATVGWGQQQHSSPLGTGNSRRRRRSESPEDDEMSSAAVRAQEREERVIAGRGKKARVGGAASSAEENGTGLERLQVGGKEGQDLGKALAQLSHPSLLALVHQLLSTNPSLRPTILALLPPPSLSTTLASLATLERAVLSALPSGAHLREEYIWGRVRVPLEEYVTEVRGWLGAFVTSPQVTSATSSNTSGDEDIAHPSTTFTFLHAVTVSLRRLEVALPPSRATTFGAPTTSSAAKDPLSGVLLPQTMNAWHVFLTRLSNAVNVEGRVVGQEMVRGWFERMDELCVASPPAASGASPFGMAVGAQQVGRAEGQARKQCEAVRERMRKEVGWLVGVGGVRSVSRQSSVSMDDEEL